MAFTFANFAAQSGQSSKRIAPAVFSYKSADAVTAVAASGYFNEVANMLLPGDLIFVAVVSGEAATGCTMLAVAGITEAGVVTTKQLSAAAAG